MSGALRPEFRSTATYIATPELMAAVNASGEIFLSHTRLRDRFVIRVAIGNLRTETRHVARAWTLLQAEAARLVD